jgi:hypothetical protein
MRYYRLTGQKLIAESVFFHRSKAQVENDQVFLNPVNIFEFRIATNPANENRSEAWDVRPLPESA